MELIQGMLNQYRYLLDNDHSLSPEWTDHRIPATRNLKLVRVIRKMEDFLAVTADVLLGRSVADRFHADTNSQVLNC